MEAVELRKLMAVIAFLDLKKKKLARHCNVPAPLFSQYLRGDKRMPVEVEKRLKDRLAREFKAIQQEQASQMEVAS